MKKKKQHYVWRKYLQTWVTNEQIWCYREGKYFQSNLMNIAQERYFYKLKNLSDEELKFLTQFSTHPGTSKTLQKLNLGWIHMFTLVQKMKDSCEKYGVGNQELDIEFDELEHNFEENFHSHIEDSSTKFIDSILNKNIDFYHDDDKCEVFLHFICVQYVRTNKMKQNVIAQTKSSIPVDGNKIWNVLSHIVATNLACSLYVDRAKFKLILLSNITNVTLITGDQPIINTYGNDEPVTKLEFYYPVSPVLAILLTDSDSYTYGQEIVLSIKEVDNYNTLISKQSYNQLYSKSKAELERYTLSKNNAHGAEK